MGGSTITHLELSNNGATANVPDAPKTQTMKTVPLIVISVRTVLHAGAISTTNIVALN